MKTKTILISLFASLFLSACGTYSNPPQAKWQIPANWEGIEKGMTKAQVRARIGSPPLEGDFDLTDTENWYYPDPSGGVVQFDIKDHVKAFHRPNDPNPHRLVKVD